MHKLPDDPIFSDTFDFSRYPIFETSHTKPYAPYDARRRGQSLFEAHVHCSPPWVNAHQRPRNVSEPQPSLSIDHMKASRFTNIASVHTLDDVAKLSSQTIMAICDTVDARSGWGVDDVRPKESLEDVGLESNEYKDENSFYSMESANDSAHPVLLSMPIIPQIKLERKATVRKPDPGPPSDIAHNQALLSPRTRNFRTPGEFSSRRSRRVLAETSSPSGQQRLLSGFFFWQTSRRARSSRTGGRIKIRTAPSYPRSASEPMLNSSSSSDDEKEPLLRKEIMKSRRSDTLLSIIEEADSCLAPQTDKTESDTEKPLGSKRIFPAQTTGSYRRAPMCHSISFTSIIRAVSEGYASLDFLLRKPNSKGKESKSQSCEPAPNPHGPKWAPKQGQIIIKVFVPSTDDIWKIRVPQNIGLAGFTSRVIAKLGFVVCFSGSLWDEPRYYFRTDEQFAMWVRGRIRFGRNLPIVAHVPDSPSLVKLNARQG